MSARIVPCSASDFSDGLPLVCTRFTYFERPLPLKGDTSPCSDESRPGPKRPWGQSPIPRPSPERPHVSPPERAIFQSEFFRNGRCGAWFVAEYVTCARPSLTFREYLEAPGIIGLLFVRRAEGLVLPIKKSRLHRRGSAPLPRPAPLPSMKSKHICRRDSAGVLLAPFGGWLFRRAGAWPRPVRSYLWPGTQKKNKNPFRGGLRRAAARA